MKTKKPIDSIDKLKKECKDGIYSHLRIYDIPSDVFFYYVGYLEYTIVKFEHCDFELTQNKSPQEVITTVKKLYFISCNFMTEVLWCDIVLTPRADKSPQYEILDSSNTSLRLDFTILTKSWEEITDGRLIESQFAKGAKIKLTGYYKPGAGIYFHFCVFKENLECTFISNSVYVDRQQVISFRSCEFLKNITLNSILDVNNQQIIIIVLKSNIYSKNSNIKICDFNQLHFYMINHKFYSSKIEADEFNSLSISKITNDLYVDISSDILINEISLDNLTTDKLQHILDHKFIRKAIRIKNTTLDTEFDNPTKKQIFENVIFKEKLNYEDKEIDCLEVLECRFYKDVILDGSIISVIDFRDSIFTERLNFINGFVDTLTFSNCEFNKTTKIVNPEGIEEDKEDSIKRISAVCFKRCTVKAKFLFNGWEDKIVYLKKDAPVDFSHLFVDSSGYVIIRNINSKHPEKDHTYNGCFNFEYANVLGVITIQESCFESLNFKNSTIVGAISLVQTKTGYIHYETLTKLKNSAIKENDGILALKYKAEELKLYSTLVKWRWGSYCDWFLLRLNNCSNGHGLKWYKGVWFTIKVSVLSFWLINYIGVYKKSFVIDFDTFGSWKGYGAILGDYMQVLNVLTLKDVDFEFNALGYVLFFLSKIFVGYGIYQTISAFRKYGK